MTGRNAKAAGIEPGGSAPDQQASCHQATYPLAADPKAVVMAYIDRLVSGGQAELHPSDAGRLELRLSTGEVFLLGVEAVTRIA